MRQLRPNRAKRRLAAGQHVIAIEGLNHPDAIERLAPLEPQAFWLEGEHWIATPTNIGDLTRACDVSGSTSIVRVGRADKQLIYHALDLGGQGIAVPHVSTAEDAARVVDAAKFAPIGHRGIYVSRQGIDVPDYFQRANDETLVVVFIEDAEALDNLDAILEVDHVRPHRRHGGIPGQHGARRRGGGQVLPVRDSVVDFAGVQRPAGNAGEHRGPSYCGQVNPWDMAPRTRRLNFGPNGEQWDRASDEAWAMMEQWEAEER